MKKYHPELLQVEGLTSGKRRLIVSYDAEDGETPFPKAPPIAPVLLSHWWEMATAGNVFALEAMLRAGCDIDAKAGDGSTALHCAAQAGQTAAIDLLLAKGPQLNIEDDKGRTPLFVSAVGGHFGCIMMLLQAGGSVKCIRYWESPQLGFADLIVRLGDSELVEAVLQSASVYPEQDCFEKAVAFAVAAAKTGQVSILQAIVNSNPEAFGYRGSNFPPIMFAVKRGHAAAVRTLLTPSGFSGERQDLKTLGRLGRLVELAARRGSPEILDMLHNLDIMVPLSSKYEALGIAAEHGHLDAVEALLDHGLRLGARDGNGNTALHLAARNGHLDIVEAFLSRDLQDDLLDGHGETPLLTAFWQNELDVVQVLSRYDVSILESQEDCLIATSLAKVAQRLLEKKKLSIKSKGHVKAYWYDCWNKTLLHLAAKFGDLELAKLVLDHQDWDLQDTNKTIWHDLYHQETALDLAQQNGHPEIVDLLLAHGAKNADEQIWSVQPAPSRIEPAHSNEQTDSEMEQDGDYTLDSDLEEQPYSYIDEYIDPHPSPPIVSAEHSTQIGMSTVAAEQAHDLRDWS